MFSKFPAQVLRKGNRADRGPSSMTDKPAEFDDALERLDREDLLKVVKGLLANGVALSFHGKRTVLEIAKRVRPRVMRRESRLHVGSSREQARNLLIEGESYPLQVPRTGRLDTHGPAIQYRTAVPL
jgi:hypothetical protein